MPSHPPAAPLSTFTPMRGGEPTAIVPGDRIVTVGASATWWDHDVPTSVALPPGTPVEGARWTRDGKSLRVGLGAIDPAARAWQAEAALDPFRKVGAGRLTEVAWFADDAHVAMLIGSPPPAVDRPAGPRTRDVVVAAIDGHERGRHRLDLPGAVKLAASEDRVLVAANQTLVLDLDAKVIAGPAGLPEYVARVKVGSGMFAAIGASGDVTLIRPADGAIVATWAAHAVDAVPVPHGVVAVGADGVVRVGCLEGGKVRTVAEVPSGAPALTIQLVGARIVVAGGGADPIRWATFASPCHGS